MPQAQKGCLVGLLGVLALVLDTTFVAAFVNFQVQGDRFVCRALGCGTTSMTLVLLGVFGAVCSLAFLGAGGDRERPAGSRHGR